CARRLLRFLDYW
nr:immunoglobulin heavy chain junction region [Mus musculus]